MRNTTAPSLTRAFLSLGFPVVLIQGGMLSMVLVDTFFVARLGPLATGGVGLGSTLANSIHLLCTGTLTALEYFSSRALGEGDCEKSWFWFFQSLYLSVILGALALLLTIGLISVLPLFGIEAPLVKATQQFLVPLGLSFFPMFLFFAARQYLSSQRDVGFSTALIIVANIANYFLNVLLVEGRWGIPSQGVAGSGMATLATRLLLCVGLLIYVWGKAVRPHWVAWSSSAIKEIANLGIPSGSQMLVRSLAFSVAGILVAKLGATAMAAHTISLNLGSFFYMVPMGMSTAACILVAHAVGQSDRSHALQIGQRAILITTILMAIFGLGLFFVRYSLMRTFSHDEAVIQTGAALLILVALLQIFDGYQVTVIGALRGFGDSTAALISSFLGLWMVGLPVGIFLAFVCQRGLVGLWSGLIFGLLTSSLLLIHRWKRVHF